MAQECAAAASSSTGGARPTATPSRSCRTAEIQRSMYIAASTMASDAMAPTSQCLLERPQQDQELRRERSPSPAPPAPDPDDDADRREHGAGRARGRRACGSRPCRAYARPSPRAGRAAAESRPWLTIWNVGARRALSLSAKMPSTIRPICAIDEYAITPRESGWRKARYDAVQQAGGARARSAAIASRPRAGEDRQHDSAAGRTRRPWTPCRETGRRPPAAPRGRRRAPSRGTDRAAHLMANAIRKVEEDPVLVRAARPSAVDRRTALDAEAQGHDRDAASAACRPSV